MPAPCASAPASPRVNRQLHGRVLDYTANHGQDRRIYSPALCQKRDLYVYLPPCYDPCKQYPDHALAPRRRPG